MAAEIRELRRELAAMREAPASGSDMSGATPAPPVQNALTNPFGVDSILRFLRANLGTIEDAFVYFNGCTDFLFYSYSQPDAVALLGCIRESAQPPTKAVLCQACAMASVGACFSRGRIPAEMGDYFYGVTKVFLDDCIADNPRSAIKVCALLAARNIVIKSTIALAYIELGLGMSRNLGLYDVQAPPTLALDDWIEQKRVWRCLLTLQFWLQTTLGWRPDHSSPLQELTWRDVELKTPVGLEDTEFFQQAMARIAILKHKLLQVLPSTVSRSIHFT